MYMSKYFTGALVVLLSFITIQLHASNFYWVGGSGHWTDYNQHWATQSGGQIYWSHVPTPTDTVIFDSLSFTGFNDTVTADNNVYCHTMKWLVSDSMPYFMESGTQPILRIYGSMQLDTSVQWAYHGTIIFCAINPGNTITTNGNILDLVYFSGDTTASWILTDTFHVSHAIFTSGNFYSGGNTIVSSIYENGHANLSRQYLDTSDVYCYRTRFRAAPIQLDADSATFIINGDSLQGGSLYYHKVILRGVAGVTGNNQIDEVIMHTNSFWVGNNSVGSFVATRPGVMASITGTLFITDTIVFNGGCSGMSAINGSGTIDFLNPGMILETVFIDGINANGNPTVNNSVVQNASGWTSINVPAARVLYWVNGQGNWSDTLHWASASGGPGTECSPTPLDDVNFDANSFSAANEICEADNHITLFNDMVCNGAQGNPSMVQDTGYAMCFGDLKVQDPVFWSIREIFLRSSSPNTVIDIQNNSLLRVQIFGSGTFTQQSPVRATWYMIGGGGYTSNGFPITAFSIGSSSFMGSNNFAGSTIYAPSWYAGTTGGSFIAPDSLITRIFYDVNPHSYNTVYSPMYLDMESFSSFDNFIIGWGAEISGNSTYDSLWVIGSGAEIELAAGSTQTITGDLQFNSSCAAPATMRSMTPGTAAYISKASGVINCDYLVLEDIHANGGATFNATNTFALQNVSGWNITPPPSVPMYWIGGTGDWNDPMHWSYSSGGSPSGCIPNPLTDVYFDALSFPSAGSSVNMNVMNGYCHNMNWTTSTGGPTFASAATINQMNCFGSVILEQGVTTYGVNLFMRAQTPGNIIDPKNADVGNIIFNGTGGEWTLTDTLGCDTLELRTGIFRTGGNSISALLIRSVTPFNRELYLDTSTVVCASWELSNDNLLILDAGAATITADGEFFQGGNRYYHEVILENQTALMNSDTFRILRLNGSVTVNGAQYTDTLILDAGGDMIRLGNDTIHVDSSITALSSSSSYIGIQSASPVDRAYISCANDTVCLDYLILQGIDASGGATFFAGTNSSDVDNNSGWTWQTCAGQIVVWPGDANYDLAADNLDILSIGIAFGETGGARPNASLVWMAQPNFEWNRVFADSTDIVHADCDGDGVIGFSDTTAVSLNYGQTHPPRLAGPEEVQSVGAEIKIIITQAAYQPGDTVELPIWLGTQNSPVNNAYGVAFTMNWDYPYIEPGTLEFDYTNSWFVPNGNNVHLEKPFYSFQYCDLGMSRINHTDTSGTGELVLMRFVLTQNANGPLKFWFTDYKMIDHNEDTLTMFSTGGTINAAVGIEEFNQQQVSVYPNPTNGNLTVSSSLNGQGTITLYDVAGRVAMQNTADNVANTTVNIGALEAGYYFLVIETSEGSAQVRVQKL
jgi:hypothetical protein